MKVSTCTYEVGGGIRNQASESIDFLDPAFF